MSLCPKIPTDVSSLPLPQKTSEARLDFIAFLSTLHESVKYKMKHQVVKCTEQAKKHMRELCF